MNSPEKANTIEKKVVLIQPPSSLQRQGECCMPTDYDAMGLLAIRAMLDTVAVPAEIIHAERALQMGHSLTEILQRIEDSHPLVFGISMNWLHMSAGALELAAILREKFAGIPIIIGGTHASLFAVEIMTHYHTVIDGVVAGEGEDCFLKIVEAVMTGRSLAGIPDLVTWQGNKIVYQKQPILKTLDSLPFYSHRNIWPEPKNYATRFFTAISTTRGGCPRDCTFCLDASSYYQNQRSRPLHFSVEHILEQIALVMKENRIYCTIEDQISAHGDELIGGVIEGMIRRKLSLRHLSLFIEPASLSREVYDLLERAPARELVLSFGIETGSPEVSKNLGRPFDYDKLYNELAYLGKKSYFSGTWWMLGLPGEKEADIQLTMKMIKETMQMGIYAHSVSPLILFPQTQLAGEAEKFGITRYFHTFEDFKKFSVVVRNESAIYPELLTHDSVDQPREMTIAYLKKIRQLIKETEKEVPALMEKRKRAVSDYSNFRETEIF